MPIQCKEFPVYKPMSPALETWTCCFNVFAFVGGERTHHVYEAPDGKKQVECSRAYFMGGPPSGIVIALPLEAVFKIMGEGMAEHDALVEAKKRAAATSIALPR